MCLCEYDLLYDIRRHSVVVVPVIHGSKRNNWQVWVGHVCVCFTGPIVVLYVKNAPPFPFSLAYPLTRRRLSPRTNMFNFLSALGVFIFFCYSTMHMQNLVSHFHLRFPQGLFLFSVSSLNHMDSLAGALEFKTLLLLLLSFLCFEGEPPEVPTTG